MGDLASFRESGKPARYVAFVVECAALRLHEMMASEPRLRPATIGPKPKLFNLGPSGRVTFAHLAPRRHASSSSVPRDIGHSGSH